MLKKSDKFRTVIRETIVWPICKAIKNLKQRFKNRKIYGVARRMDDLDDLGVKAERRREMVDNLPNITPPPLTNGAVAILAENKGGEVTIEKKANFDQCDLGPFWIVRLFKRRQPLSHEEVYMSPKTPYKESADSENRTRN